MNIVAIILARGGSKGLPNKNILDFCGKPLIAWTIENCINAGIESVWVSSDSDKILEISSKYGAKKIKRPENISGDFSSSESAWLHAIELIESKERKNIDWVLAPQVTSPIREAKDIKNGISIALEGTYDSIFSCSPVEDLFFWETNEKNVLESVNYDWKNRKRRQEIKKKYIENGSFYMFTSEVIKKSKNRFGDKIGKIEMDFWKMFEIDSKDDFKLCQAIMTEFIINKSTKNE